MTQFSFGIGQVFAKRTDVANTPPAQLGTIQDIQVTFNRTIKELMGQFNMPVAIAGAGLKVEGKAKFAKISATTYNNLFFGQSIAAGILNLPSTGEVGVVPTTPFQVTVANSATFVEDLGVYNSTTGVQLTPVASGPITGQYSVAAGIYTFAVADVGVALLIYYSYKPVTGGSVIALTNQLMGTVPVFSMTMKSTFTYFGVVKDFTLKLNACVSSKFDLPHKNADFLIQDFDFQAFADASNAWGTISSTE